MILTRYRNNWFIPFCFQAKINIALGLPPYLEPSPVTALRDKLVWM